MMYIERLRDVMIVSITLHYIDRSELQYNVDLLIGFVRMIYTETWIPAHLKPQRGKAFLVSVDDTSPHDSGACIQTSCVLKNHPRVHCTKDATSP
jgi:hypothetical protein